LLALGIFGISVSGATRCAHAGEPQNLDPGQCQEGDKACIQAWYKEYSAGLLSELKYYAGQEDFLAEMLADPREALVTAKLSLILIEGGTRYSRWAVLDDEATARSAGLDMPRYQAILGVCRDAISGMHAALFDLREHRDKARNGASQYLKNALACEKAFGIAPVASRLRSPGQARRAPAPVAPNLPLDIMPRKEQP
jgi:hypothetical protein